MLSSQQDAFFERNMYENFGDIGMNIKKMVDEFQQVAKSNQTIQTIGISEAISMFTSFFTTIKLCFLLSHEV